MSRKHIVTIDGEDREIQWDESNGKLRAVSDNGQWDVDVQKVGPHHYSVLVGESSFDVRVAHREEESDVFWDGKKLAFPLEDIRSRRRRQVLGGGEDGNIDGPVEIKSMMPGKIVSLKVKLGDTVTKGQGVVVLEAMKMENELNAPKDGEIKAINVSEGQSVESGSALVVVE